jgi:hypothetical protein
VERELGRRGGDERFGEIGVEPDAAIGAIHRGAGADEEIDRPVAEDLDPDLGEDPEGRPVDLLDVVGRQDLERSERVRQRPERELRDASARAPCMASMGDGLGGQARVSSPVGVGVGNIGWSAI